MVYNWSVILQIVSSAGLLAIICVLQMLSRRLGEALQMRPYYYLYTVGCIFIVLALLIQFLILLFNQYSTDQYMISIFSGLLALGVTFIFIAALKYWGWFVKEFL